MPPKGKKKKPAEQAAAAAPAASSNAEAVRAKQKGVIQPIIISNKHAGERRASERLKGKKGGDKPKEKKDDKDKKRKTAPDAIAEDIDKPERKKVPEENKEPGVAADIDPLAIHPQLESEVELRPRKWRDQPAIKPFSLELVGDDFTVSSPSGCAVALLFHRRDRASTTIGTLRLR